MENIKESLRFYYLATELKNIIRTGWDNSHWNINAERRESVAEHIFGTCILAISKKNNRNIDIIKNIALPTGILNDIDLVVYDRDIEDNDIIVMCSDGIIESNSEYKNKETWVKNLLEQMETTNAKKIADILLKEAIDNNYGKAKDDMTVIVTKIIKK